MTSFEPVQAGPYLLPSDPPNIAQISKDITDWAATRLNMRFASTTARDAAIPAPVEGMECVTGTGAAMVKWLYYAATWVNTQTMAAISVQATKNATQAMGSGVDVAVTFPTEDWDSSGFHDLVTSNQWIQIPTGMGGKYLITGKVEFVTGTTPGASILSIYKNDTQSIVLARSTVAAGGSIAGSIQMSLAAGDHIVLAVQVAVASTLQSSAVLPSPCYFSAVFLGT